MPVDIVTLILIVVWLLKVLAIFNAILWLNRKGVSYRQHLAIVQPTLPAQYYQVFEKLNGDFFPFGIKDFRLRQFAERNEGYKVLTYGARFFQAWLFRYNRLILITSLYLFIIGGLVDLDRVSLLLSSESHSRDLYLLAIIALWSNFLLSIEIIYSYATLKSYAMFHMHPHKEEGPLSISELKIFVWRILTTVVAGATAAYVAYLKYNALSGQITGREPGGLYNRLKIYFQCIYFIATTFVTVGYGDIIPVNGKGQLIAFLIEIQSFSLVVIVFAALIASRSQQESVGLKK